MAEEGAQRGGCDPGVENGAGPQRPWGGGSMGSRGWNLDVPGGRMTGQPVDENTEAQYVAAPPPSSCQVPTSSQVPAHKAPLRSLPVQFQGQPSEWWLQA